MTSGFIAFVVSAQSAAEISVPGNIRPVNSIVTWTCSGTGSADRSHRPASGHERGLCAQEVERRFDEEQIDASLKEPPGLHLEGVPEIGEEI